MVPVGSVVMLKVPYFRQETDDTCAPACLRMALAFRFGNPPNPEAPLAKRCGCLPGLGSLVDDVFRTARRHKLPARWLDNAHIESEVEAALKGGYPVLANVQLRLLPYYLQPQPPRAWHSVLIVGMDGRAVFVHDPDPYRGGPHRQINRPDFFAGWDVEPYSAYCV